MEGHCFISWAYGTNKRIFWFFSIAMRFVFASNGLSYQANAVWFDMHKRIPIYAVQVIGFSAAVMKQIILLVELLFQNIGMWGL